jgi:hypothetical protein
MKKLLVGLLMVPALAHAEFESGNSLLADIQSAEIGKRMHALGYVKGVADVYVNVTFCVPKNASITAGQISDMVRNHLEMNPAIRHHTAESIINGVLTKAWPCAANGRNRV